MALMLDANFFIAVIVATIVSFVIGGIWYGPLFGKMWMAGLGRTQADMESMRKQAPKGYAAAFVGNLIAAAVLAIFLSWTGAATTGIAGGLLGGFLVWLGFIATSAGPAVMFEGRSAKVTGINVAYSFVSYVVMGAIIKIWIAP